MTHGRMEGMISRWESSVNGYYRRASGIASRVVEGEAFLIKMPENVLFVLNHAASRIWVRADGTRSGEDLVSEWDHEAAQAFFDEMAERGLLRRSLSPCESADVFPQDVTWPELDDPSDPSLRGPPRIRVAEAVVAMGGCNAEVECETNFSF